MPGEQSMPPAGARSDGDLRAYVAFLLEQRWLIATVAAGVVLAGAVYAGAIAPQYESNLVIRTEEPSPTAARNILSEADALFETKKAVTAEIELLRSRMVITPAVERLRLDVDVAPVRLPLAGHWLDGAAGERFPMPGLARFGWQVGAAGRVDVGAFDLPDALLGHPFALVALGAGSYRLEDGSGGAWTGQAGQPLLSRTARGDVRLLVERIDAATGARFALTRLARQAVVAAVQKGLSVTELGKQSGVIELRLQGDDPVRVRDTLDAIGQEYLRQNAARSGAQAERALALLDRRLPALKSALEDAENRYNQFRLRNGTVDLNEETKIGLQRAAAARVKRAETEQRRNELSTRLGDNHPAIAGLDRQLADIDADIRSGAAPLHALPLLEQEEARLLRDVKVNAELYGSLSNAARQLRILALGKAPGAALVDGALLPDRPVKPNRPLILFAAAVAGMVLGMTAALLRRALRAGIHSVDRLEQALGERVVLANIPHSDKQAHFSGKPGRGAIPLLATAAPGDPAVEALRALRTALQFALPGFRNNIVMITGPTAGLGKSFVAANAAAISAAGGRKTLLIDMDMRNGELHRYFGMEPGHGLYEVVTGAPGCERSIRYGVLDNLDFVPAGAAGAYAGELLVLPCFDAWLDAIGARYDLVVVDAAPILAVADAAIVGARAGAVLVVARAGVTTERELAEAVRRLNQAGIAPDGVLFNDARLARAAPEYQYRTARSGRIARHA